MPGMGTVAGRGRGAAAQHARQHQEGEEEGCRAGRRGPGHSGSWCGFDQWIWVVVMRLVRVEEAPPEMARAGQAGLRSRALGLALPAPRQDEPAGQQQRAYREERQVKYGHIGLDVVDAQDLMVDDALDEIEGAPAREQ